MKAPLDMAMAEWRRQISMKHDDGGDDEGDGDDVLVAIFVGFFPEFDRMDGCNFVKVFLK